MKWQIILVVICCFPLASALGVAPANTKLTFFPDFSKNITVKVVNSEHINATVRLEKQGGLSNFIHLHQNQLELKSNEKYSKYSFELILPKRLSYGTHYSSIVALLELPGRGITSEIGVAHKIIVNVPANYSYVTAKLNATLGKLKITFKNPRVREAEITYKLELFDNNISIISYKNDTIRVPANSTRSLQLQLERLVEGSYTGWHTVIDNSTNITLNISLTIGKLEPVIKVTKTRLFAKKINKFNISVINNWNKEFKGKLYAELVQNGSSLAKYTSPDFTIAQRATKNLVLFIDATKVKSGKAKLILTLDYNNQKKSITTEVNITEKSVKEIKKKQPNIIPYLAIALLLAMISAIYLIIKKR